MEVRVKNEELFENRFLKAVKKAHLKYEFKEFYNDTVTVKDFFGEPVKINRHFKVYEVEELPPSDWEVVKRFDHQNGVVWSFGEEGHNELLNDSKCECCNTRHKRVFTYLLRNKKNPLNLMQVGRSCLHKFIPNPPKFSYDDYLEFLEFIDDEERGLRCSGFSNSDELPAKDVLVQAVLGFEFFGRDYEAFKMNYDYRKGVPYTKEAKEKAEKDTEMLLDWVKNYNPRNGEYLANIYAIANNGFVVVRNIRLWQSAVCLLQRARDFFRLREERAAEFSAEPLKTGKQTLEFKRFIKVSSSTYEVSYYTSVTSTKLHLETSDNKYVVLTVSDYEKVQKIEKALDRGNVKLQVTVKDSSEFNGVLYNFANRVKIIELPPESEEIKPVNFKETENGKALDAMFEEWES